MRTHTLFKEYIWLINTIAKTNKISLEEINRRWIETDMSEGVEFSRRTFIRHKNSIEDMFGIFIECDKKDGFRYYIDNVEVLREHTVQNWTLSTLSVSNIVGDGISIQDRIIIESVPVDNDYLTIIINAMKTKHKLVISYKKYGDELPKDVLIEPYCLKMFKQRWYVVGHCKGGEYKIYSLDRIVMIIVDKATFKMDQTFDAHSFFSEYFGILRMETVKCEKVVLRAFGKERFYLRDLPMHSSQRVRFECEEYADFHYRLRPTSDFCSHLLSRAAQIKVIEPQWLADKVRDTARGVAELYS